MELKLGPCHLIDYPKYEPSGIFLHHIHGSQVLYLVALENPEIRMHPIGHQACP